jgi:hypothetical protein
MKYALIDTEGFILETSAEELTSVPDIYSVVEITDEQALQLESSSSPLFLINGNLVSLRGKLWAENPEPMKEVIRRKRNNLLANSDWTQLSDSPLDEDTRSAWATYRQNLRDLTDNIDENGEVDYPVAP